MHTLKSWFLNSISRQVSILLTIILSTALIIPAFYFYQVQHDELDKTSEQLAKQLITSLKTSISKPLLYNNNFDAWQIIKSQINNNQKQIDAGGLLKISEIAILDKNNNIFAHSTPDSNTLQTPYKGTLLSNDIMSNIDQGIILSKLNDTNRIRLYTNAIYQGNHSGLIILELNLSPLVEHNQQLIINFIFYFIIASIIIIFIGITFGKWISSPLNIIENSLVKIGTGRLNLDKLKLRHDEYKILALALENTDRELHNSQSQVNLLLDSTAEAIYGIDIYGNCSFVNRACLKILKYANKSQLLGKNMYKTLHNIQPDENKLNNNFTLDLEQKTHIDNELIKRKDNTQFPAEYWSHPIYKHGECIGAVVTFIDISKRVEALNTLKERESTLRRSQKMDAIGQLAGGIAHDFNNQLGVVIGYLDILQDSLSDEKQLKWIEKSNHATLRCIDLTRQLLAFSRTKSTSKKTVNVNTHLHEFKVMIQRTVTPQIEVEYILDDDLWLTDIDSDEFQDAILNLVINARDEMPNGGKLVFETSNKILDKGYATNKLDLKAGEYIQIILSDTGRGMDKKTLERLFEPFFTTKESNKGTGLGLAMVYSFIKRFDGGIQFYSEVNIGTTIHIYLPRSSSTILTDEPKPKNLPLPSGNEKILVVDDELDLLDLASSYLTDLGYQVETAENANQAVDVLTHDDTINLVFSDIVMPGGMTGYELAEHISKKWPNIKILLTSGFTSRIKTSIKPAEFEKKLLNKPYRKTDLASRIRLTLDEIL